jgi:hypothetical protein
MRACIGGNATCHRSPTFVNVSSVAVLLPKLSVDTITTCRVCGGSVRSRWAATAGW